jgi:hypothetical protein
VRNQIKNNRNNNANQNASCDWKIKGKIFPFNVNVAWQFSKIGNFSSKRKNQTKKNQNSSNKD